MYIIDNIDMDLMSEPGEADICDTPFGSFLACFAGCLKWPHPSGGTAREIAEVGEGTSGDWNRWY